MASARNTFEMHGIDALGYATDLIFPEHDGEIEDHGDYLCVRTPHNPQYMWGNFLLFRQPPTAACADRWPVLYRERFGADPWFITFGWPGEAKPAAIEAFEELGFVLEWARILVADTPSPPARARPGLVVRALDEKGWQQALWHHIRFLCHGPLATEQRRFEEDRFASYRRLRDQGLGQWYGAYLGEELVGDMGIFVHRGMARFQEVLVHPDHRGQGVCRTLCQGAAALAAESFGARRFVTLANEPDAIRAYASIGFADVGVSQGFRWFDLDKRPPTP